MSIRISRFMAIAAVSLFLFACGSNAGSGNNPTPDTAQRPAVAADTAVSGAPTLSCRELPTDSTGTPHSLLYLVAAGKETLIDTVYSCGEIARSEFSAYEIPSAALIARGGWWAGGGDYFYLILRDGKPVVYAGWQDEGQTDNGYHWEERKLR